MVKKRLIKGVPGEAGHVALQVNSGDGQQVDGCDGDHDGGSDADSDDTVMMTVMVTVMMTRSRRG